MGSLMIFAQKLVLEELEKVIPKQAFWIGKSLVACRDVGGITFSTLGEEKSCSGFVHLEKTASKWFKVSCKISTDGSICNPACVCFATPNMMTHHRCCKHVSALLLSLFVLENFQNEIETPKLF